MNNQNDTRSFYTGIALLGILFNHTLYREIVTIAENDELEVAEYIAYRAHELGKAMMEENDGN